MKYSKELLPITEICLNVTEECNLACRYCFTEHHPHFMTFDVARDTLLWLTENAKISSEIKNEEVIPHIGFFGGEPTLMWDTIIVPLVTYAEENNIPCTWSITSNCVLMNKEKVDFCKEHNFGLLLSMDGNKCTQDYNRPAKSGESSFDLVSKNLPYIKDTFPLTTFRATITPKTAGYLFDNIMFAAEQGFQVIFAIINEFEEWTNEAREILKKEIFKYCLYVIDACIQKQPFIKLRPWEQAINKIAAMDSTLATFPEDYEFEFIGTEEKSKCGLGNGYGSVNYKGEIFACQEVASREGEKNIFLIGDIYNGIDENKLNDLRNAFLNRPIKKYNFDHPEQCETCQLRYICVGNMCQVNNYILYKDFAACPDCWCWWSNLMVDAAAWTMHILGKNKNEFFLEYLADELTSQGGPFYGS